MIVQDLESTLVDYKYSLPFYALSTSLLFYLFTHSSLSYLLFVVAIAFATYSLRVEPYSEEEYRLFDLLILYNVLTMILSVVAKSVIMLLFSLFQIAFLITIHLDTMKKIYNFIVKHIAHLNDILALSHFFLYLLYAITHANILPLMFVVIVLPLSFLVTLALFYKNNDLVRNTSVTLSITYLLLLLLSYLFFGLFGVAIFELLFMIPLIAVVMWMKKKLYKEEVKKAKDLTMDDIKYSIVLNKEGIDVFLYYDSLEELKEKEEEVKLIRELVMPMFPALLVSFVLLSLSLVLSNV